MTRHFLAIPLIASLLVPSLSPSSAQTNPANPQGATTAKATAPAPVSTLSDEETARLYLVKKQYREAEEIFHRLIVEHPKNAVYWNELGISFHNQAELASALKC